MRPARTGAWTALTAGVAVALGVACPSNAHGQSSDAQATAKILVSLSLTKNRDLNMGIYSPGAGTVTTPATSPNAGKFTATGTAGNQLQVSYPGSITLSSGGSSLSFTGTLNGNSVDDQATSSSVGSGNNVTLSSESVYYFWLGGSTTVGATTPTGTYTGTFTLTVRY